MAVSGTLTEESLIDTAKQYQGLKLVTKFDGLVVLVASCKNAVALELMRDTFYGGKIYFFYYFQSVRRQKNKNKKSHEVPAYLTKFYSPLHRLFSLSANVLQIPHKHHCGVTGS